MESSAKRRVLLIVLDGATLDLVNSGIKKGVLPTFKKLIEGGTHGNLTSSFPPNTSPAFDCLLTGLNPGKIGIYSFMCRRADNYDFIPCSFMQPKIRTIWNILSESGKEVAIVNVPTSYYSYEDIRGVFVPGWLALDHSRTHPPELYEIINKITKGYALDPLEHELPLDEDDYLKLLYNVTEKQHKITKYLINECDWDFFMVVFTGTDRIQHRFWGYMDEKHHLFRSGVKKYGNAILDYYKEIDRILNDLMINDDATIFIISDHGFGPVYNQFFVNGWLIKQNILRLRERKFSIHIRVLRKILGVLWRITPIRENLRFAPATLIKYVDLKFAKRIEPKQLSDRIDWSTSKAYGFTSTGGVGQIYINLKGREPNGIVEPGKEFEECRDHIIKELEKLSVSMHLPIKFFKKEELYHGEHLNTAPDILFILDEFRCQFSSEEGYGSIFNRPLKYHAGHRINGMFIAFGKDIKVEETLVNLNILDITPTILHIFDIPIPTNMDGRVLHEIFEGKSELAKREIKYQQIERERIKRIIKTLKRI